MKNKWINEQLRSEQNTSFLLKIWNIKKKKKMNLIRYFYFRCIIPIILILVTHINTKLYNMKK